jgi:eukaryotic-like serine/threonine-protein kinase
MIGQIISHYKILSKLGEGGMGAVYKAHDTKLDRDVALKFLPDRVASSAPDRSRFMQEARAAAALNHPNVCSVIDIQDLDGQLFIVMEYVDGQTLRDMASSGQALNIKRAIDIGIQIAEGLSAAHEKGIVHRDIKPENIMVRKDGRAQIMDFGLAKLQQARLSRLTKEGSTIGTAGYMSPEQVQGEETDHRSDIFSLGAVLYELFTGKLPFKGVHETALLYEIVNVDAAPMSSLMPEIDSNLDAIVLECLEKDPRERAQSAAQIAIDLKRCKRESTRERLSRVSTIRPLQPVSRVPAAPQEIPASAGTGRSHVMKWIPWLVAGILACAVVALVIRRGSGDNPGLPAMYVQIPPPEGNPFLTDDGGHIALSPDGSILAFVAQDSAGRSALWLRNLDNPQARKLAETEGATYPFWSPDNRSVAFFASGKLKRMDVAGGPAYSVCDAPNGRGGSWNRDGVIIFSPKLDNTGIFKVQATGGDPVMVTKVDTTRNETNHRWPEFLPDGKRFLFTTQAKIKTADNSGAVYIGSIVDTSIRQIMKLSTNVTIAGEHLLFVRQHTLMAQRFDPGRGEIVGDPLPVGENVSYSTDKSHGMFTVSAGGLVVYQLSGNSGRTLYYLDQKGKIVSTMGDRTIESIVRACPDGNTLVFDATDPETQNLDVWLYNHARGISTRFTFDHAQDGMPVISPDGRNVIFFSDRTGTADLYLKGTGGTETEQLFSASNFPKIPCDWSRDGKYVLLYTLQGKGTDVGYIKIDSAKAIVPFLSGEYNEDWARFSPDGRWIVYESDESGKYEVYVTPFPSGSGKWQVSSGGGLYPTWSPDGKSIYYCPLGTPAVLEIAADGSGSSFHAGESRRVFAFEGLSDAVLADITPDGSQFLVMAKSERQNAKALTLMTGWERRFKTN